jgi:hypothetical protein
MNKEQKINYVFFWLQCFGERDNETFNKDVTVAEGKRWSIWRQFDYTADGDRIEPSSSVSWSNKLVRSKTIEELSEEELDLLIEALNEHQTHW